MNGSHTTNYRNHENLGTGTPCGKPVCRQGLNKPAAAPKMAAIRAGNKGIGV